MSSLGVLRVDLLFVFQTLVPLRPTGIDRLGMHDACTCLFVRVAVVAARKVFASREWSISSEPTSLL